jgi:anti-anti-sigma factor
MSLVVTDFDGVIVVNVTGEDCSQVWKAVETQVKDGRQAVVVDLAQVPFLNSVNIAALIAVRNKLAANGGRMAICNLQEPIKAVFRILKLERLFDLNLDRLNAVAILRR